MHAHQIVDRAVALIFDELIPLTKDAHSAAGPEGCPACHAVHHALRLQKDAQGIRRPAAPQPPRKAATRRQRPRTAAEPAPPAAEPAGGIETPPDAIPAQRSVGQMERVESARQMAENRTGERPPIEAVEADLAAAAT